MFSVAGTRRITSAYPWTAASCSRGKRRPTSRIRTVSWGLPLPAMHQHGPATRGQLLPAPADASGDARASIAAKRCGAVNGLATEARVCLCDDRLTLLVATQLAEPPTPDRVDLHL